ncbi:hypothetical protein EDB89DRAFT_1998409 [Lactarius sanguifluus]|nr:hypothetical protein EDB89DRAFT_1998409 [Lactarius sanguifluus]
MTVTNTQQFFFLIFVFDIVAHCHRTTSLPPPLPYITPPPSFAPTQVHHHHHHPTLPRHLTTRQLVAPSPSSHNLYRQ